jgi:hypothetical protein
LENILLRDEKKDFIKISDFGLSRLVGEGSFMQTICGTPEYLGMAHSLIQINTTLYFSPLHVFQML